MQSNPQPYTLLLKMLTTFGVGMGRRRKNAVIEGLILSIRGERWFHSGDAFIHFTVPQKDVYIVQNPAEALFIFLSDRYEPATYDHTSWPYISLILF